MEWVDTRRLLFYFSKVVPALVIGAGTLVLLGWCLAVPFLIRLIPSAVAMNPVTALLFLLSGLSLECLQPRKFRRARHCRAVGCVLTGLVVLAALWKLTDYLIGLPVHVDGIFLPERFIFPASEPVNQMAPNTALNFVFCGVALWLCAKNDPSVFVSAQILILAAGLISLVALIGYSYQALALYQVGHAIPMALETAVLFLLFCIGFLAAHPERGIMELISSRTAGGMIVRRLLPVAILTPWGLGALLLMCEAAGLLNRALAVAIFATVTIVIFAFMILWTARHLYVADVVRGQAQEQLKQASADLQRSNTDLQQFAYVASHDLLEPLRMVTSYLELLHRKYGMHLDDQGREFMALALDGARRMNDLIHDLLAYSRLDVRGRAFEPIDSERALRAALANLKIAVQESGAVINHSPLPQLPADPVQLTQVFQNLIGNALKFHGKEAPRIDIGAERQASNWLFHVRDNGIGIESQQFERIFVIFQRLHTRAEYAGTGMGLAICKKIIERHGGRIWVESLPGMGATFFFTLPASA